MAINLSTSALLSALRLSDTPEENQEATRLLAFATETISTYLGDAYAGAPSAVLNESAIRLCGYLFDQPYATRSTAFSNALRNSGAGAMLLPYRVHRGGLVSGAEAVAAAQAAVGSTGNPVVNVEVSGSTMTITFADGTTRTEALPSGMGGGGGIDQTARDAASSAATTASSAATAAATAQTTANSAQAEIDAHEATPHNTDQTARDAAAAAQAEIDAHEATPHNTDTTARASAATAQSTANAAQAEIDAHEATTHNTDQTARDAAEQAQSEIDSHESSTHNHDAGARTAAGNAQSRADSAYTLAEMKVDESDVSTLIESHRADANAHHTPPEAGGGDEHEIVSGGVFDGHLEGSPVVMRLGWNQSRAMIAAVFTRANDHPIDGAASGMTSGLAAPPFPPALNTDATLYLGLWVAGDPEVAALPSSFDASDKQALSVGGVAGHYFASRERLPASTEGAEFRLVVVGPRIITVGDIGRPVVLYEAQSAAIGGTTALVSGDVVCPETGDLEFYFEGLTGTRRGGVAYARIPAARIPGAVSAITTAYSNDTPDVLAIAHGANRGVGGSVQANTNYMMLSAQAPGNFYAPNSPRRLEGFSHDSRQDHRHRN